MQPHPFLRKKEAAEPPSLRQRNPLQDRAAAYGGKIALCLALTLLLSLLHGTVSPARADGEQADTAAILAGQAVAYATNSGPAISPHSPAYPPCCGVLGEGRQERVPMPPLSKPRFSLAVSETPTCGEIADALRRTTLPAMADRGFLRIAKGEWVLLSLASASPRLRIGAVRQSLYYRDSIRRMFMRAFA